MRNFLFACFFSFMSAFSLFSCGLHEWDIPLTEERMVEALQEALFLGSKTAADNLGDSSCVSSKVEAMDCATGYLGNKLVEIAVPDTVKNVLDKINSFTNALNTLSPAAKPLLQSALGSQSSSLLNLGRYGDSIKVALNRGAEMAAPASISVFKNAIFGMSFVNAKEVLKGDSIAATSYLNKTTYSGLQTAFGPIIKEPLDSLNMNKYWRSIASNYNSFASSYSSIKNGLSSSSPLGIALGNSDLPDLHYSALPDDLSAYLSNYATGKALDGLFFMVGKQEASLRADPWGTVSALGGFVSDAVGDLLGDVFSKAKYY